MKLRRRYKMTKGRKLPFRKGALWHESSESAARSMPFHFHPLGMIAISIVSGVLIWWITSTLEKRSANVEA